MSTPLAPSTTRGHQSIIVPPDVLAARRENTTASMLAQLHAPSSHANPSPFQGFGLYTDVKVEVPQRDPRLAHKHCTVPKFLPLGGPHDVHNKRRKRAELPDEVVTVYDELKAILLREEEAEKRGTRQDPLKRFERLKHPEFLVPPPLLPGPTEMVPEPAAPILETNEETRAELGEETVTGNIGVTGLEAHEDVIPNINSAGRPTEATEQGTTEGDEALETAVSNTQESGEIWGNNSDVEIIESLPAHKQTLPVYKKERLFCCNCKTSHANLKSLIGHIFSEHIQELRSVYYRCCADHPWNASLTSYVPHWTGIHGWGKQPFPCPTCALNFKSIPEARKHYIEVHYGSSETAPGRSRDATPTAPVNSKTQRSVIEIRKNSRDPTSSTSEPSNPRLGIDAAPTPSLNLNIRCLRCRLDFKTVPSLTMHLFEHHMQGGLPKLWWECCNMRGTPVGATLRHLEETHGWRDRLPCPGKECSRTFEGLPSWHAHVKSHIDELRSSANANWRRSDDMQRHASRQGDNDRRSSMVLGSSMDLSDG